MTKTKPVPPVTIASADNTIIYCDIVGDDGISRSYRIVLADLSTIQVKEGNDWKLRRSTHGDIMTELAKFLPAGYTVDMFADVVKIAQSE